MSATQCPRYRRISAEAMVAAADASANCRLHHSLAQDLDLQLGGCSIPNHLWPQLMRPITRLKAAAMASSRSPTSREALHCDLVGLFSSRVYPDHIDDRLYHSKNT